MDDDNPRLKRIERLLDELRYEVTRGMMEREIEERLDYGFVLPSRQHGRVVTCYFSTRVEDHPSFNATPRLRVVGGKDAKP